MRVCESYVDCAVELADTGRRIALHSFRRPGGIAYKADGTPQTNVDVLGETEMRRTILDRFPDHGVVGEEFPPVNENARCVWHVDALDGTRVFAVGAPNFSVLITLLQDNVPVLGIVEMPALRERWIGGAGQPTRRIDDHRSEECRTSGCETLHAATVGTTKSKPGAVPCESLSFMAKARQVTYGAESLNYGLLASGFIDLAIDAELDPHDYLPMVPIVEGAGGVVTDLAGRRLGDDGVKTALAAATVPLHEEVLSYMHTP